MTSGKESPPEVMSKSTPPPTALVEQYKIAVELYSHEDRLNWAKLNNLFYVNAGLWAAVGFIIQFGGAENVSFPIDLRFFMGMVSVIGMIVCVALGVALWVGVMYMNERKGAVIRIEKALIRYGGKYIVSPAYRGGKERGIFRRSPTMWMLKSVPIVFFIVWLVAFWVSM